jgi:hypothetical protein
MLRPRGQPASHVCQEKAMYGKILLQACPCRGRDVPNSVFSQPIRGWMLWQSFKRSFSNYSFLKAFTWCSFSKQLQWQSIVHYLTPLYWLWAFVCDCVANSQDEGSIVFTHYFEVVLRLLPTRTRVPSFHSLLWSLKKASGMHSYLTHAVWQAARPQLDACSSTVVWCSIIEITQHARIACKGGCTSIWHMPWQAARPQLDA